mmetsp:Transcript_14548/g.38920  ORF Transcript_14548/g.38920 Transcript_14548/m.38920 type:complete len:184 (+) Transcript_14548:41-592(+)
MEEAGRALSKKMMGEALLESKAGHTSFRSLFGFAAANVKAEDGPGSVGVMTLDLVPEVQDDESGEKTEGDPASTGSEAQKKVPRESRSNTVQHETGTMSTEGLMSTRSVHLAPAKRRAKPRQQLDTNRAMRDARAFMRRVSADQLERDWEEQRLQWRSEFKRARRDSLRGAQKHVRAGRSRYS